MENISSYAHSAECFIREEEEEELFLVFGNLFNPNPRIMLTTFLHLLTSKEWSSEKYLKKLQY